MRNVDNQIKNVNEVICKHIESYNNSTSNRGFLSQNILSNLRTLVEAVSVKASWKAEYSYEIFNNFAKNYISANGNLKFLKEFHIFLQKTVSHYVLDEENSERLMLKYYEYLLKIRIYLKKNHNLDVLENLNYFPISCDYASKEYYEKIILKINQAKEIRIKSKYKDRYYIKKVKPIFVNQEIYYEVTFTAAVDNVSKFDRQIAFTKHNIMPNYSVKLDISKDNIEIFWKLMPIQLIDNWEVSIRPCELEKFAEIFGDNLRNKTNNNEITSLMALLTKSNLNLLDVANLSDEYYAKFKNKVLDKPYISYFFNIFQKARRIIKWNYSGVNTLRYLLYNLNNNIIKNQISKKSCTMLSNLSLQWGCIPFEKMPFCSSLIYHNPKIFDLLSCIDISSREHELFARIIKNNTEQKWILYTPINTFENIENIIMLVDNYNKLIYDKHKPNRYIELYKEHVYINEYEQDTFEIISILDKLSKSGIKNYSNSVEKWLKDTTDKIDCEWKRIIIKNMFENSQVALIYWAAWTGKTRLIEHISSFFWDNNKLYLANTNPAINNLENRIKYNNSKFKTISSFLSQSYISEEFDLLIIDECSTVSNRDMLKVLKKASYKLLILVGDVFQIESILFWNWFAIAREFMTNTSKFELENPYRTKNPNLLNLWGKVRNIDNDICEHLINNNYCTKLDESIFHNQEDDEIILCLNYDGLYWINNINKLLQWNNINEEVQWGIHIYKVGDPILFNESNRFKPLIHNNLKGKIIEINIYEDKIQFDVEIDKSINAFDTIWYDLYFIDETTTGKSIIRFNVFKLPNTDQDTNTLNSIVPFQVAYAVSIHKAQGLEYNSVKVVITNEIEEMVTHNIFYTAITRAKENLKIYWTPDTQNKVLNNLTHKFNKKDYYLLKSKFNL